MTTVKSARIALPKQRPAGSRLAESESPAPISPATTTNHCSHRTHVNWVRRMEPRSRRSTSITVAVWAASLALSGCTLLVDDNDHHSAASTSAARPVQATAGSEQVNVTSPIGSTGTNQSGDQVEPSGRVEAGRTAAATPTPTTSAAAPAAAVGGLYMQQASSPFCTATVLDTPAGNVAVTAAQCIAGREDGILFRPGVSSEPRGSETSSPTQAPSADSPADETKFNQVWRVSAVYAPAEWISKQSGEHDIAILKLAPAQEFSPTRKLQGYTGGHMVWSRDLVGRRASILGYSTSADGQLRQCNTRIVDHEGMPALKCVGASRDLAGAPWFDLSDTARPRRIVGLTGGHLRGGCDAHHAYTPNVGAHVVSLLSRALSGEPGDDLPRAADSPCPVPKSRRVAPSTLLMT